MTNCFALSFPFTVHLAVSLLFKLVHLTSCDEQERQRAMCGSGRCPILCEPMLEERNIGEFPELSGQDHD